MQNYILLQEQYHITENKLRPFTADTLTVYDDIKRKGACITITRTLKNCGDTALSFVPCISVKTENTVCDWFVPSVSYSGNAFGDGMEPKGLLSDGEPWVFPSDHAGVPGCTVVMGGGGCSALFLSPSQVKSACSLEIKGKTVIRRGFVKQLF